MKTFVLALLLFAFPSAAFADCLGTSQIPVAISIAANAYSIAWYDWHGDPAYDQRVPYCGAHPGTEFACNAVAITVIVVGEDVALRHASQGTRNTVCVLNWLGSAAFAYYTHAAVTASIFHVKL